MKMPTLASLARRPAGERQPKAARCRNCLADEAVTVVGQEPNRRTESSLLKGACRDRAACEARQPSLF